MRFKSLEKSRFARIDKHTDMLISAVNGTYFFTENCGIIFTCSYVDVSLLCVFWMSYVVSRVMVDAVRSFACCVADPYARRCSPEHEVEWDNKCAMEPHLAISRLCE